MKVPPPSAGNIDPRVHYPAAIDEPASFSACRDEVQAAARRGSRDQVALWLRRALACAEPSSSVFIQLGLDLTRIGAHEDAERAYVRALLCEPSSVEAHANLSALLASQSATEQAIGSAMRALILRPDLSVLYGNMAQLQQRAGKSAAAERFCQHGLVLTPQDGKLLTSLGLAAVERDRSAAQQFFQAAIIATPSSEIAYINLSALTSVPIEADRSLAAGRRAIQLAPTSEEGWINLAGAADRKNRLATAWAAVRTALALDPGRSTAWAQSASIALNEGRQDISRLSIKRAIELAPEIGRNYRIESMVTRYLPNDSKIVRMEALLQSLGETEVRSRAELHFALAKAYDDIGLFDERFNHLLSGNALIRQGLPYDSSNVDQLFDAVIKTIGQDYLSHHLGQGWQEARPIFVVGMPRSGTSLLEQMLAGHSEIWAAGETTQFSELLKRRLEAKDNAIQSALSALTGRDFADIGREYARNVSLDAPPGLHIVDKTPEDFRYVGLIRLALPKARIIHIERDPIDTCMSCFSQLFSAGQEYSYDLNELGHYYHRYRDVMTHWRSVLGEHEMVTVRYEQLVADPKDVLMRVLEYCDLPWQEACLDFQNRERSVRTASAAQVRKALYSTSIGKYQRHLARLAPLLAGLEGRMNGAAS